MSLHTPEETKQMAKTIINELIAYGNKCEHDEFPSNDIKCEELKKTIALARIVGANLEDM